ncbi:Serine/threonine-protein kinase D3 [Dissophora ornata]|nr:Serine/threonine-protein kinase D3 [Dissophora ornata]
MSQRRPSASTATITRTTESVHASPLPANIRAHMDRDRVMIPSNASDVSEDQVDAFAEGEVLEVELSDNEYWNQHSPYRYSAQQVRLANARCSSSTLFDESRPSSQQGSWSQHGKDKSCSDSPNASPNASPVLSAAFKLQQKQKVNAQNTYGKLLKKDQAPRQGKISFRCNQGQTTGDSSSSNMSCADSPTWTTGARLKIEPSTPAQSSSHGKERHIHADSGAHSARGSSPLSTPTMPLTPTPAELDKPTKNLMKFNQIPRQWPSSQETLHHNFMAKAIKKTPVIEDFDTATAERIDRLINKERPETAKEKPAAEQKEAELEARGFFDPARRGKGRDVYPRPANWVYCRRTKNNWLEKTKILADNYKLLKGEVLGKGHHADVYKGTDLTTGQDLAIKVIYKTVTRRLCFVSADPAQEVKNQRLLNEAWFVDYLKDAPGICKILRVVETPTKFYFVMELAQSDLNSYSNGIEMREEEIRHILKPIFECLKYAHSQNIIHRDIKPENILLKTRKDWLRTSSQSTAIYNSTIYNSTNSNSATLQSSTLQSPHHVDDSFSIANSTFAKESSYMGMDSTDSRTSMDSATLYNYCRRFDSSLADWGLAVEHDSNSGRKPVGTPLYAAPEVVRKMKKIRRREWINYRACDIWSLGVTMFVVASGRYPYHTDDALEAQSPPNWTLLESSGMSEEYIALTQRLMNLTAELRPSAAEACDDPWLEG